MRCFQINGEILLQAANDAELKKQLKAILKKDSLSENEQKIKDFILSKNYNPDYKQPYIHKLVKNMLSQPVSQFENIKRFDDGSFKITSNISGKIYAVHPLTNKVIEINLDNLKGKDFNNLSLHEFQYFDEEGNIKTQVGIESMWDLFQALGGYYTNNITESDLKGVPKETTSEGLVSYKLSDDFMLEPPNNKSWEYLALIETDSTTDSGENILKEKYVSMALPKSTVKTGQPNMIANSAWFRDTFKIPYSAIDNYTHGSQLYAGTMKKNVVQVTGPTQSFTALGFSGRSGLDVEDVYRASEYIADEGVKKLYTEINEVQYVDNKPTHIIKSVSDYNALVKEATETEWLITIGFDLKPNNNFLKVINKKPLPPNVSVNKESFEETKSKLSPNQQAKFKFSKIELLPSGEVKRKIRELLIEKSRGNDISQALELLTSSLNPNYNSGQLREFLVTQLNSFFSKYVSRQKFKGGQYVISPQTTPLYDVTLPDGSVKTFPGYYAALKVARKAWSGKKIQPILGTQSKNRIEKINKLKTDLKDLQSTLKSSDTVKGIILKSKISELESKIKKLEKTDKVDIPESLQHLVVPVNINGEEYTIFDNDTIDRQVTFVKINDNIYGFYRSSAGTDGKQAGMWYPFYGLASNWVIKDGWKDDIQTQWTYNSQASPELQEKLKNAAEQLNQHWNSKKLPTDKIPYLDIDSREEINQVLGVPVDISIDYRNNELERIKLKAYIAKNGFNINQKTNTQPTITINNDSVLKVDDEELIDIDYKVGDSYNVFSSTNSLDNTFTIIEDRGDKFIIQNKAGGKGNIKKAELIKKTKNSFNKTESKYRKSNISEDFINQNKEKLQQASKISVPAEYKEQVEELLGVNSQISFQGYKGGFDSKGKGTPQGDGKDKAMRKVADGFIGELAKYTPSSTLTSATELLNVNEESIKDAASFTKGTIAPANANDNSTIIMLARNSDRSGKPLNQFTKDAILERHNAGSEFVVGDMPNVDTQFIEYLIEIGAKFTVYHTGNKSRINVEELLDVQAEPTPSDVNLNEVDIKSKISKARHAKGGNISLTIEKNGESVNIDTKNTELFRLLKEASNAKKRAYKAIKNAKQGDNTILLEQNYQQAKRQHQRLLGLFQVMLNRMNKGEYLDFKQDVDGNLYVDEVYKVIGKPVVEAFEIGIKLKDTDMQQFGIKKGMQIADIDIEHFRNLAKKRLSEATNDDIEKEANILLNSFNKVLEFSITRTPGQDKQSIFPSKVAWIIYNGDNNVEAPTELEYFQGADQDIDKGNIAMLETMNGRIVGWHPDFEKNLDNPNVTDLPLVYGRKYKKNSLARRASKVIEEATGKNLTNEEIIELIKNGDLETQIILNREFEFNEQDDDIIRALELKAVWKPTVEGLRNIQARRLFDDVVRVDNAIQSQMAMEMDDLDFLARLNALKRSKKINLFRYDPVSIDSSKIENVQGKLVIGIAATLIKVTGILQTAVNRELREPGFSQRNSMPKPIKINGKEYNLIPNINYQNLTLAATNEDLDYIKKIIESVDFETVINYKTSDGVETQLSRQLLLDSIENVKSLSGAQRSEALDTLRNNIVTYMSSEEMITFIESQFLSAATDNAKELILSKINVTSENAGLLGTMLLKGVPLKEAVDYLAKPKIQKAFPSKKVAGKTARHNLKKDETPEGKEIFALKQESDLYRIVGSLASLNQGFPNSFYAFLSYMHNLQMAHEETGAETNLFKEIINYTEGSNAPHHIALISQNPHYRALIEALQHSFDIMTSLSSVNKIVSELVPFVLSSSKNKIITEEDVKSYIKFVKDLEFANFLTYSETPFIKSLRAMYSKGLLDSKNLNELKNQIEKALWDNRNKLQHFKSFMIKDESIPSLYRGMKGYSGLKPRIVITSQSPEELAVNIDSVRSAFSKDAMVKIPFNGKDVDFRDLLFMYDMLVQRSSMNHKGFARFMRSPNWQLFSDFNNFSSKLEDFVKISELGKAEVLKEFLVNNYGLAPEKEFLSPEEEALRDAYEAMDEMFTSAKDYTPMVDVSPFIQNGSKIISISPETQTTERTSSVVKYRATRTPQGSIEEILKAHLDNIQVLAKIQC